MGDPLLTITGPDGSGVRVWEDGSRETVRADAG